MTSIHTNTSAMAAISVLRGINSSLGQEQSKIATGMRISTAADNSAFWSIATTMKSEAKSMTVVVDGIALASGIMDTAYSAMQTVHDSFVEIRNIAIIASQEPPADFVNPVIGGFVEDKLYAKSSIAKLDRQMQQYQDQARDAIMSASFAGVNLVHHTKNEAAKASETVHSFVIGYSQGKLQTLDVKAMDLLLINDDAGSEPYPYALGYNPEQALFDLGESVLGPGSLTPAGVYWFNIPVSNPDKGEPEAYDVTLHLRAGHAFILEDPVAAGGAERVPLQIEALVLRRNPSIPDTRHPAIHSDILHSPPRLTERNVFAGQACGGAVTS